MKEFSEKYIRGRLKTFRGRSRRTVIAGGLLSTLSLFLVLSVFLLYLDALLVPDSLTIISLLALAAITLSFAACRWILPALVGSLNLFELARKIERMVPAFYGRLTASLEEDEEGEQDRLGYSNSFRNTAIESAADILGRLRSDVISRRLGLPVQVATGRLVGCMVICLLAIFTGLVLKWPVPLTPSAERIVNPFVLYRAERTWDLTVYPGDIQVMKGDSLSIDLRPSERSDALEPLIQIEHDGKPPVKHKMVKGSDLSYRFHAGAVERTFHYFISEGKRRSPDYEVKVNERPAVTELKFRIIPPAYTGMPLTEAGRETRRLYGLKGGSVEVSGHGSRGIKEAVLDFSDSEDVELEVRDGIYFSGGFILQTDDSFHVVLVDTADIRSEKSVVYSLNVLNDRKPEVRIVIPGRDKGLSREMVERIRFTAGDDFGLNDLDLHYGIETREGEKKEQGAIEVVSFRRGTQNSQNDYLWDLKELGLFPGENVRYRAEVHDNDMIAGPKSGWSREYIFSLPTVSEIFSRRRKEIEDVSGRVRELMEKTNSLRDAIGLLEREMEVSGEVDWESRKEAADIERKQTELSSELRKAARHFQESVEELKRDEGVNLEILKKADEVSRLFQEVGTPEMKAAMEELRKALEGADPSLLERAISELKFSEEDFMRGLDKTYRALKRLQMEQRLDSLVRETADILERQESLTDRVGSGERRSEKESWRKEEESITSDMDRLMTDMKSASDELREEGETEVSDQLDKLALEIEDQQVQTDMEKMAAAIGGGDFRNAVVKGGEIAEDLEHLKGELEALQEGLGMKWKKEVAEIIDHAIADLLVLSSSEEKLYERLPEENARNKSIDTFIAEQSALQEGLENTAESLFRSTEEMYFIGRDVGQNIGSALNLMRRISHQIESRGQVSATSKDDIRGALKSLNRAILSLMRDKETMMGSSSGAGLEKALQQMMKLAKAQAALNEKMAGMFPLPLSGIPGSEQDYSDQLLRMAAEQRQIQEGLESLREDLAGGSRLIDRVDHLAEEMKRMVEKLGEGEVNQEMLDLQRRIHSRLLDAEKSIRKRDFSRKREAERPDPYVSASPPSLSLDTYHEDDFTGEGRFPITGRKYPEGYRDAIRIYFDSLMKQEGRQNEK